MRGKIFILLFFGLFLIVGTSFLTYAEENTATEPPITQVKINFKSENKVVKTKLLSLNNHLGTLPKISKKGYTFLGWYDGEKKVTADTLVFQEKTMFARWKSNVYQVTFISPQTKTFTNKYTYDKGATFPKLSKQGLSFKGWATTKNGKVKYKAKTVLKNLSTQKKVTLYAVWQGKNYKVNYIGTYVSNFSKTYNTKDSLKTPSVKSPIKKFLGWSTTPGGKVKYKPNQKITDLSKTKQLYAVWKLPRIEVWRTSHKEVIYSGTGKVVKTFPVSLGAPGSPTPLGNFQIIRKVRNERMPDAPAPWTNNIEYTSYFTTLGHAFHVAEWLHWGGVWHMGGNPSHGCVNNTYQGAKYIYENCPIGTKVQILNK